MLSDLNALRTAHIILASGSPRRVDIFNNVLQLQARVEPSRFEENLDKSLYTPVEYVKETARQKALEVFRRLIAEGEAPPKLVVGADTVVVSGEHILEKPKSDDHARAMLIGLSGTSHQVCTGVALLYGCGEGNSPNEHVFAETTEVEFAPLDPALIDAYIATGEPMDKAGSYGIQGLGGVFVKGIRGCYQNVVGFPLHRFCAEVDAARLGIQAS
mmetsp:Transcript_56789/g.123484  ORF Transcript_56789/g.123484 Transcript_56789/m.123484 type:complete len:215 (-) Transcript_56789:248-892(-)